MKEQSISISGMTCNGCKTIVEKTLYAFEGISEVNIDLDSGQGMIKGHSLPQESTINNALAAHGHYKVQFGQAGMPPDSDPVKAGNSYKPLFILACYLIGGTLLIELASGMFLWQTWMPNFMAAFFLSFSFFKMLDIDGFARSYRTYDMIAASIPVYGKLFPFIELGLGFAYILFPDNPMTHLITAIIMFVSLVGVVRAVWMKKQIQCACLGTVFNLPMSYVTVIEDSIMLIMAVLMYIKL